MLLLISCESKQQDSDFVLRLCHVAIAVTVQFNPPLLFLYRHYGKMLASDVREGRGTCAPTDAPVITEERIVMF